MRETHPTPTTSLANPPDDHTSGASTPSRSRQKSTKLDRSRQNSTETRARPPAREACNPPSAANRATMKSCYYEDGTAIPDHPDLCAGRGKPWATDACK